MTMRFESVRESEPALMRLSEAEALALNVAGRALVSRQEWWGAKPNDDAQTRSVIRCTPAPDGRWTVTVSDAIGCVVVGSSLQLDVRPKIPIHHFLFLANRACVLPRVLEERGAGLAGRSLWELIVEWFVGAVERLLRRDLVRGYDNTIDELNSVRGAVLIRETTRMFYAGRLGAVCEFDEFEANTALNRLLKAAAQAVGANSISPASTKARAARLVARMDGVDMLQREDLHAMPERQTAHYADAILLAKLLLRSVGRSLVVGSEAVWTFLIRTPEVIEEGIRSLFSTIGPFKVRKQGRRVGQSISINPDLIIFDRNVASGVADVKYKMAGDEWRRSDLYQIVAFSAGFGVADACVIDFTASGANNLETLAFGDVRVVHLAWNSGLESPADSAKVLALQFSTWAEKAVDRHRTLSEG